MSLLKSFVALRAKKVSNAFLVCLSVVSISACDLTANYTKTDRASDMNFQDFRDGLSERTPEVDSDNNTSSSSDSIPALQPYISTQSQTMQSMPLVSVRATTQTPLRDVLYLLAEQANYDLELDPSIRGAVMFTARDKPFDVVIRRLSQVAGLRYKFDDSFLRVEVDTPFHKTYKVDYLSFIRANKGDISTSVSVVSGEGADTGSTYTATSDSLSDFWGELELNMTQILENTTTGGLRTQSTPQTSVATQNPDVAATSPNIEAGSNGEIQAPDVQVNVQSLPVDDIDSSNGSGDEQSASTFSINKQGGLINVRATERVHKEVAQYLNDLRKSVTAQVLVEAKIFEVSLNDEYINGIEWQALTENGRGGFGFIEGATRLTGISATTDALSNLATPGGTVATGSNFGVGYVGNDVGAFVEAISGFGTVRALASPRLTVLNNQSAVLNVATNRVFFEIDLDRETDDDTGDVTLEIDTDIKSVPEGVLINVQPSINLENKTISMFLRPTITRIVGTKQDPSVQFVAGSSGIVSEIPEVNIQEIDTVVRVPSGQPIVMGGLLQDRVRTNEEGVPVLGEMPVVGSLFKKKDDLISKTELVIFLKATLVETSEDTIHDTDRDLYRTFSGDRRPLDL